MPNQNSKKQLVSRWTDQKAESVVDWLSGSKEMSCPTGTIDVGGISYADLRGFDSHQFLLPRGLCLERVDFTCANMALIDCVMVDCSFKETCWNGQSISFFFERCNFAGASCKNSEFIQSVFLDCDMTNCDFRDSTSRTATFNRCDFTNSKFQGAKLGHRENVSVFFASCNFTNASFDVVTKGNVSEDYKNSIDNVVFASCNLNDINWGTCDTSTALFLPHLEKPAHLA